MTEQEAIKILYEHNRWRRGENNIMPHSVKNIGEAIDVIVKEYENKNNISKPKSLVPVMWEECIGEEGKSNYYINDESSIREINKPRTDYSYIEDRNILPTRELAEGMLALSHLLMLRNETWRRDEYWEPNWMDEEEFKYVIYVYGGDIRVGKGVMEQSILAFRTMEIRDAFLKEHKDAIVRALLLL
jgi:hypothetical protein